MTTTHSFFDQKEWKKSNIGLSSRRPLQIPMILLLFFQNLLQTPTFYELGALTTYLPSFLDQYGSMNPFIN